MPTGFTYKIADGTDTSVRHYILQCARGMGALATMRDDPVDAPIPTELTPDTAYDDERIAVIEADLARLRGMTSEAARDAAAKEFADRHQAWQQRRIEDKDQYERYTLMIARVAQLTGLPDGLHEFMISQLIESRGFDCSYPNAAKYDPEPVPCSGEVWLARQLADAERRLIYYTRQRQEELDRTAKRNAWLAQLHTVLEGLPE